MGGKILGQSLPSMNNGLCLVPEMVCSVDPRIEFFVFEPSERERNSDNDYVTKLP